MKTIKRQFVFCMICFGLQFSLLSATVNTPMTQALDANGYDIYNITNLSTGNLITKFPRVDVRAFGATGDGVTDDTDEIRAAVNYANSYVTAFQPVIGGLYVGVSPEVYFPKGRYKVSDTINVGKYQTLVGGRGRCSY